MINQEIIKMYYDKGYSLEHILEEFSDDVSDVDELKTACIIEELKNADTEALIDPHTYDKIWENKDSQNRARCEARLLIRAKELKILSEVKKVFTQYKHEKAKEAAGVVFVGADDPNWLYGENNSIDEVMFCNEFITENNLKCINKRFYGLDGYIPDELIENKVQDKIERFVIRKVSAKVKDLVSALKIKAYSPSIKPDMQNIHIANGTINIDGIYTPEKFFCLNRLNVEYPAENKKPQKWLEFLSELLHDEDIPILQEYIGYCLLPTNKGQIMLIITGQGGEGKSRIGIVLKSIFGKNAVFGKVQDFEHNRFSLASLENKLLFIDDDLKTSGLRETGTIKNIVTAETALEIEHKGKQKYEADIYSRIILFGNGILEALYDHTDGFYRRQVVIEVKPKKPGRIDNKNLIDELAAERDYIFMWAFEGLQRLIKNEWHFSISERSKTALEEMKQNSFNFTRFLADEQYIRYDKDSYITSSDLCVLYDMWCRDNQENRIADKTALSYLKSNAKKYNVKYAFNLPNEKGQRVRGFKGMKRIARFFNEH